MINQGEVDHPESERLASAFDCFLDRHFSRIITGGSYFSEIDGLRFIAIAPVFFCHLAFYLIIKRFGEDSLTTSAEGRMVADLLHQMGLRAVLLFFVISGFVLGLPFARAAREGRRSRSLKRYLIRRITRLEPPYIISLVILGFLTLLLRQGASPQSVISSVCASFFYVHGLVFGTKSSVNFVTWSLEIEVQFYLIMPLLAVVYRLSWVRARWAILVGMAAAVCLLRSTPWYQALPYKDYLLTSYLEFFLAGMWLAELASTAADFPATSRIWDLIFVIALVATFGWPEAVGGRFVLAMVIALAFEAGRRGVWGRRFLCQKVVSIIGGMCYSIYLWHVFAISAVGTFTLRLTDSWPRFLDLGAQVVILSTAGLAISGLAFVLIERPCMRPDWPARVGAWWVRLWSFTASPFLPGWSLSTDPLLPPPMPSEGSSAPGPGPNMVAKQLRKPL